MLLVLLAVAMVCAAGALVARGVEVSTTLRAARVESYLELVVLAGGVLAAAWVGLSALVALLCLAARSVGRTWSRGERLVAHHAPALVRRAARIGVSVSVGTGLVLGGGTAYAAEPDATDTPSTAVVVDLGWRPSAPVPAGMPTTAPAADGALGTAGSPGTDDLGTDDLDTEEPGTEEPGTDDPVGDTSASGVPTGVPPAWQTSTGAASHDEDPAPGSTTEAPTTAPAAQPAAPATAPTAQPAAPAVVAAPGVDTEGAAAGARGAVARGATDPSSAVERDAALTVTRDAPTSTGEVVVLRGDTLWAIAARALPADASDADVAAAVERWHAANVDVIGADPDLIRPGQVLVAPSA
ncbi:LysM peptidoglycan-binding domain-containing protein [Cellulosimicrobium sp. NPDC057127]|uniref:LysM peptidoglycan-binding domain-containing protein n=1 Tax=Cellulosimicrobium sp. NPDC057127 TaxID=3346026 RepID=UPI0036417285